MGGSLDLTRGKQAVAVTVDPQRQHHVGRELLVAGAPVVDANALQPEPIHRFDQEMDPIIFRRPIPQVGWQQHWRLAVYGNKSRAHEWKLLNFRMRLKGRQTPGNQSMIFRLSIRPNLFFRHSEA